MPDPDLEISLHKNIAARLPELKELLETIHGQWRGEDGFYRFYHHSFKVFYLQDITLNIVKVLESLLNDIPLNATFRKIVHEGTGKVFSLEANHDWLQSTRQIVEAFFHAREFLRLAIKYGEQERNDFYFPTGWAAILYLYNLR